MADLSRDERTAWIGALERAAARAWPPHEDEPLGGWRLRYGGARSRRLNSVWTSRFLAGGDVRGAIEQAAAWYRERGLPPCFQIAEGAEPAGLDGRLAARGYAVLTPTTVMQAPVEGVALAADGDAVPLAEAPTPEHVGALCDPGWPADVRADRAALFARIPSPRRFAVLHVDGEPAAAGLCVVDDDLAGIFSMRTARAFRRRGLGTRLLRALAGFAQSAGATRLYLQVEDDSPARALYLRLGFEPVYGYHYRELA
ncbi:MAG TPA: GNAT family N-acetyltransferase [Myxococcota bacterium]|nr:GNAT family N-acetyltransferase [Myxococcota bacterium]